MSIEQNDLDVVIQALQAAIAGESDDGQLLKYRDVLKRLYSGRVTGPVRGSTGAVSLEDGFRYDYDDSSDLYGNSGLK